MHRDVAGALMIMIQAFDTADPKFLLFQSLYNELYGNHPPDSIPKNATCYLALREEEPVARLSFNTSDPSCGIIGHFEALNPEAAMGLLKHIQQVATDQNIPKILGPINGTTWDRYRIALPIRPDDPIFDPPHFLGEPRNPPEYASYFVNAGFSVAENYESRLVTDLLYRDKKRLLLKQKMDRMQIDVSPINLEDFYGELEAIFSLSLKTFAKNPYYQPINFDTFKTMYEKIKTWLDPEFVLIARNKDKEVVGFSFNYPDLESTKNGLPTRLIVKTLAIDERLRAKGLAMYLLDEISFRAYKKGYESIIHALMHCDNDSFNISQKGYQSLLFKRYALYEKEISI